MSVWAEMCPGHLKTVLKPQTSLLVTLVPADVGFSFFLPPEGELSLYRFLYNKRKTPQYPNHLQLPPSVRYPSLIFLICRPNTKKHLNNQPSATHTRTHTHGTSTQPEIFQVFHAGGESCRHTHGPNGCFLLSVICSLNIHLAASHREFHLLLSRRTTKPKFMCTFYLAPNLPHSIQAALRGVI